MKMQDIVRKEALKHPKITRSNKRIPWSAVLKLVMQEYERAISGTDDENDKMAKKILLARNVKHLQRILSDLGVDPGDTMEFIVDALVDLRA